MSLNHPHQPPNPPPCIHTRRNVLSFPRANVSPTHTPCIPAGRSEDAPWVEEQTAEGLMWVDLVANGIRLFFFLAPNSFCLLSCIFRIGGFANIEEENTKYLYYDESVCFLLHRVISSCDHLNQSLDRHHANNPLVPESPAHGQLDCLHNRPFVDSSLVKRRGLLC